MEESIMTCGAVFYVVQEFLNGLCHGFLASL